jgi:hypothetical protein
MDDVVEVRVVARALGRAAPGKPVDDQVDWLFDWWGRLDAWVAAQRPAARTAGLDAAAERVAGAGCPSCSRW